MPSSLTVFMVKLVLASVFLIVTVSSLEAQDAPRNPALGESLKFQHLEGQDFSKANFRDAELTMTRFQGANLSGADFTNAKMDRTELDDANLSHAIGLGTVDFGLGVSAHRANFQHADLRNARVTGTYFEGADLSEAILDGVQWDAAIIADVKGVTKSRQAELKSNAGRWKHDLTLGFGNFMQSFSVPMWLLCWIAGGIVLVRGWRRTAGHLSLKLMTGIHVLAGLPALAFVLLLLCGTSPTAQLSGNPDGWSRWVHIWTSLFSFGRLIVIGYVPLLIVAWIVYFKRRVPGVVGSLTISAVLTGLTLLFAVGVLMLLAPTA